MANSEKPYKQWVATFGLFTLFFQIGINYGWTSPNMARLRKEDSPIPLTAEQASWIASCPGLGLLLGAMLALLANILIGGRKNVIFAGLTFSTSWIILIATSSVEGLYVARTIGGMAMGLLFSSFALFVGEISSAEIRGSLISIGMIGSPIGIVIGTIMETYLPIKTSSAIYLTQCIASTLLFLWLMDSPYYLVRMDRHELAVKSILFYNGANCNVDKELVEITNFIRANVSGDIRDKLRELFTNLSVRRSLVLMFFLSPLPSTCGVQMLLSYMETILDSSKSNLINAKEFVIYANVIGAIMSILAFNLVDKLGRRLLLTITLVGIATGMTSLGVHFFLLTQNLNPAKIAWLPLVSILIILITMIGLSTVPSTILSELFSDSTKSVASFLAALSNAFFSFASIRIYQPMSDAVGECYVFWLYAVVIVAMMVYFLLALPETKGKTLQDIQNDFVRRKNSRVSWVVAF